MTEEKVIEKLKKRFGCDFKISSHDGEEKRLVMKLGDNYRPVTIPLSEWINDYDASLSKFIPVYRFLIGKQNGE